jgi:hypothetical protein
MPLVATDWRVVLGDRTKPPNSIPSPAARSTQVPSPDLHAGAGLAQRARQWRRERAGRHQRRRLRRVADLPLERRGIDPVPVPACGLLGAGRIPQDESRQHGAGEPSLHSAPLPPRRIATAALPEKLMIWQRVEDTVRHRRSGSLHALVLGRLTVRTPRV